MGKRCHQQWVKVTIKPKPDMGSISYKNCNNKVPTLNPKLENEKKNITKKTPR